MIPFYAGIDEIIVIEICYLIQAAEKDIVREMSIWGWIITIAVCIILYKMFDWLIRVPRLTGLSYKYILISGTDAGFGYHVAKRLDQIGCNVFACYTTENGDKQLRKQCSSRLKLIKMDVSDALSVKEAFKEIEHQLPYNTGLWCIINTAGVIGRLGPAEWLTRDNFHQILSINLLGMIDTTMTFLPLVKKEMGRIVIQSSAFGRFSIPGAPPYCVSKFGVEAFSDSLRRMLKPFHVSVHVVELGLHSITKLSDIERSLQYSWTNAPALAKKEYGEEFISGCINNILNKRIKPLMSDNITTVVDLYENASLGFYPRLRYRHGIDTKIIWFLLQILPDWLGDYVFEKMVHNKPLPAICKEYARQKSSKQKKFFKCKIS